MDLYLYNSLSRKKEKFVPLNPPAVGLYTCGPTVYGPSHIGHIRSYISYDILKRVLGIDGYKVTHVMNITDVHDSIIKRAKELSVPIKTLSDEYTQALHKDVQDINAIPANFYPKVTENIDRIIGMVKILMDRGYAYVGGDGSVYYNVSKFKDYGKLSGVKVGFGKTGTRVSTDKYERKEAVDFALWKSAEGEFSWGSPWGRGRPGWHIECSVMSKRFLGDTFDIHCGGVDLKFPHHENEIAQSEAANGVRFVKYWVHSGLLDIGGEKMSRSLGNVYSLADIESRGFSAMDFRYLTFLTHYRASMNFTWEALAAAQKAYGRLKAFVSEIGIIPNRDYPELGLSRIGEYSRGFLNAVNDDLNMPKALALVWKLIKDEKMPNEGKARLLEEWDAVLGLKIKNQRPKSAMPKEIQEMLERRGELRRQGKFGEADVIRKKIEEKGYKVEDMGNGSKVTKIG